MKNKYFISILLILCLAINAFIPCNNPKSNLNSWIYSASENYTNLVSQWKQSAASDSVLNTAAASVTPGRLNENFGADDTSEYISALDDITALKYYYEGKEYAYGIDGDGNEFIALRKGNGKKLDALNGAGSFKLINNSKKTELSADTVSTFLEGTDNNGNTTLTVNYALSGLAADGSTASTVYTFAENSVNVKMSVVSKASAEFSKARSYISRSYPNGYNHDRTQVNEQWVYPENMDYPYPEFESLVFIDYIDSFHKLYTSVRGDNVPSNQHMVEDQSSNHLPVYFEDCTELNYTHNYDISFVDTLSEHQSSDYLGLFKGKNSDFAVGVAAVTSSGDNSTVFEGNSVTLNINVTNLLNRELTYSLRYDIRDYYGNIVDAGLFTDNKISSGLEANRSITVSGSYGMYYLNLYAISENSAYKECYPFALLEKYDYTYSDGSPFGIASAAAGKGSSDFTINRYNNTALLMNKIGVATLRAGNEPGYISLMTKMRELGVTRINGGYGPNNYNDGNGNEEANIEEYVNGFMSTVDALAPYIDSIECGNEMSLYSLKSGGPSVDELFPIFYFNNFLPTKAALNLKYPGLTYIPTPCSACETSWLEKFLGFDYTDTDGTVNHVDSFWSDIDVLTTHIYGNPYMPDAYSSNSSSIRYGEGLWSIEAGMQRIKKFLYENPDESTGAEKDFYLTEVGYPTAPESAKSVSLRAQADYTVRIGAICSAYGADRIQYYQMYDRTSYNSGFDNADGEYNFGLFYKQDYYDIVKPKPAGIAFAVLTRQLESITKNSGKINSKYDEGYDIGGVRAFTFDTALYGEVTVAYSNAEVLTNGRKNKSGDTGLRKPNLPWNNEWLETDETVFEAAGEIVTVYDIMGNKTEYTAQNGTVTVPLGGSPVYIRGIK